MKRFLDYLKDKGIECYYQDRIPLEKYEDLPDSEEKHLYDPKKFLETDKVKGKRRLNIDPSRGSLFKFFLDGSRRTYKLGDILLDSSTYIPLVAGQIGVACCQRINGRIKSYRTEYENLLVLPDEINDLTYQELNEELSGKELLGIDLRLERLSYKKEKGRLEDQAVAKINSEMQKKELELIETLHTNRVLDTDCMMILDGSLEFNKSKIQDEWFRHVVGVSKSFNSNLKDLLKSHDREIGTILVNLEFGERTPVFKLQIGNLVIGAWYLRIRERKYMRNPMEGIVKVEKIALKSEGEDIDGIDSNIIDNISLSILNERLPTCNGKDNRWASHLYPVYLTEMYLKQSFVGDYKFLNIF